jgi:DNA-binding NarL/FixJ family response regulator
MPEKSARRQYILLPSCCHLAKSKIANEEELTETQGKVFGKMREGKKTGQIAGELCIGEDTARRIRGIINHKAENTNLFLIYDWGIYKGHFSRKLSLLKNKGR